MNEMVIIRNERLHNWMWEYYMCDSFHFITKKKQQKKQQQQIQLK